MSAQVCIIGNLNADLVLYPLRDFPAWGTEVLVSSMDWRPGGIGNALLCLARLGVEVSALANVGDDLVGQQLLSTLRTAGVDTGHVERSPDAPTALSVGLGRDDGERAFVTHLGHLGLLDVDLVLRHREAWKEAQFVLFSGHFLRPGLGFEGVRTLIDEARAEGKKVLFDTGWDVSGWPERSVEEVMQLVEHVDVFLPSLSEAQALTGAISAEDCLEILSARCPGDVIVKMGEGGSITRTAEGVFRQPAFPVAPLDTTGAGDSFNAGVILGLLKKWAIPETLRFANAVAALVISRPGSDKSRYPTLTEVADLEETYQ